MGGWLKKVWLGVGILFFWNANAQTAIVPFDTSLTCNVIEIHYSVVDSAGIPTKGEIKNKTYYWYDSRGIIQKKEIFEYENGQLSDCPKVVKKDEYTSAYFDCNGNMIIITGDPLIPQIPVCFIHQSRRLKYVFPNGKIVEIIDPHTGVTHQKQFFHSRYGKTRSQCYYDRCGNELIQYLKLGDAADESGYTKQIFTYEYHPVYQGFWIKKTSAFNDEVYDICERELLKESPPE